MRHPSQKAQKQTASVFIGNGLKYPKPNLNNLFGGESFQIGIIITHGF